MPFPDMSDGMGDSMGDVMATPPSDADLPVGVGLSLSYHAFIDRDTDVGKILNIGSAIELHVSENAHGIGWIVPDNWTGGAVQIYAEPYHADDTDLAALLTADGTGFVDSNNPSLLCYDFVAGPNWPLGELVFHARVTKTVSGRTVQDVTSGIYVSFLADHP